MVYIDVKFDTDYQGNKVITVLRWTETLNTTGSKFTAKYQMVEHVKNHPNNTKTKYYRNGSWHVGEDVRVVDGKYLRTDANNIKADNLGNLPEI